MVTIAVMAIIAMMAAPESYAFGVQETTKIQVQESWLKRWLKYAEGLIALRKEVSLEFKDTTNIIPSVFTGTPGK